MIKVIVKFKKLNKKQKIATLIFGIFYMCLCAFAGYMGYKGY